MNNQFVYVKVLHSYEKWGEVNYGEVLGVFDGNGMLKDKMSYLDEAEKYIMELIATTQKYIASLEEIINTAEDCCETRIELDYRQKKAFLKELWGVTNIQKIEMYLNYIHIEYLSMLMNNLVPGYTI